MALLIGLVLCFGLALGLRWLHVSGRLRGRSEADVSLAALFEAEEADEELFAESEAKERTRKERGTFVQRFSRWIAGLRYFGEESEGRNLISMLERELSMAGMRTERFGPYQALAFTTMIWGVSLVVPTFAYASGAAPVYLAIPLCAFGLAYPVLKLRSAKAKRRQAIEREIPRFIRQLSMALSSRQVTLPDAIERVVRSSVASSRRSPLAEEFGRAYAEFRHGRLDLPRALQGIATRTGVPGVDAFIATLVAAHSTGADVRASLEGAGRQAQEMFKQATRQKIARSETKFIFGLFFTFLGALPLFIGPLVVSMLHGLGN